MTYRARHAAADADAAKIGTAAKFVLVMIARRAGKNETCWPSMATIAEDTGLSEKTVRRALPRLVEHGHLEVIHRPGRSMLLRVLTADTVSGVTADTVTYRADTVSGHRGHSERGNLEKNQYKNLGGDRQPPDKPAAAANIEPALRVSSWTAELPPNPWVIDGNGNAIR